MTVIGMVVSSPDQALVWADCAVFRNGEPTGHQPKLTVNPTARIAGAGTGWGSLLSRFGDALTRSMSIDELAETLPNFLRRESASIAARRADPERFLCNGFCMAGWSTKFRRFIGLTMEAEAYFEPSRVSAFSSPRDSELESMGATCLDDVTGLIQAQVVTLGLTTTGAVVGATLTPAGISTRTLMTLEAPNGW